MKRRRGRDEGCLFARRHALTSWGTNDVILKKKHERTIKQWVFNNKNILTDQSTWWEHSLQWVAVVCGMIARNAVEACLVRVVERGCRACGEIVKLQVKHRESVETVTVERESFLFFRSFSYLRRKGNSTNWQR